MICPLSSTMVPTVSETTVLDESVSAVTPLDEAAGGEGNELEVDFEAAAGVGVFVAAFAVGVLEADMLIALFAF